MDRDSAKARATFPTMNTTDIEARASKAGITIPDLLKRAGINRATWWRWSTGRFQPRAGTVERINNVLNRRKP